MQAEQIQNAAYAGDVSAQSCWQALQGDAGAQLIDVRTAPEWAFSGLPALHSVGRNTHSISWRVWPDMAINPAFTETVCAQISDKNTPLYLICKTGGRSAEAAMALTQAGYTCCYNVEHGFEGDRNDAGQRGTINGWKAETLPWEQQ